MSEITTAIKVGDANAIKTERDILLSSKALIEISAQMTDEDLSSFIETNFPNFTTSNKAGILKILKTERATARLVLKMIQILKTIT